MSNHVRNWLHRILRDLEQEDLTLSLAGTAFRVAPVRNINTIVSA